MSADPLQDLLDDEDRDKIPGAMPVVSYVPDEEAPEFLSGLQERATIRSRLIRRGGDHGHYAALDPTADYAAELNPDLVKKRWRSAKPFVLAGAFGHLVHHADSGVDIFDRLSGPDNLHDWISGIELPGAAEASHAGSPTRDPERDLEKIEIEDPANSECWIKLAKLSTHPDDDSLRLRIGFGREREDDASPLLDRQRLVSELGRGLLPGMDEICQSEGLMQILGDVLRGPALLSQPLVYWNRPGGGALFHHDAFGENSPAGQRGVLYVQLGGETLWLALSINDLALRVREMIDAMTLGDLKDLRELLYPNDGLEPLLPVLADDESLLKELGLPGCGRFSSLVNYGPSFTSWLADSGHACLLGPGDAILLPNHGLHHTCMHSVFCVSDHTTYALSMAVRLDEDVAPDRG